MLQLLDPDLETVRVSGGEPGIGEGHEKEIDGTRMPGQANSVEPGPASGLRSVMDTSHDDDRKPVEIGDEGRTGFGLGLLVGAVVGAAVALLLAPGSGRDTRRQLRRRLRTTKDQIGDRLEELDDRVRDEIRRRR